MATFPIHAIIARTSAAPGGGLRPPIPFVRAEGKFLTTGEEKFYARGVTYGTFAPDQEGSQFPGVATVRRDFRLMAANVINAIRTYTVPPVWLLDAEGEHGLRVMVGLPWKSTLRSGMSLGAHPISSSRVREMVRTCRDHWAVLAYVIGNEIPATIVRQHGRQKTY